MYKSQADWAIEEAVWAVWMVTLAIKAIDHVLHHVEIDGSTVSVRSITANEEGCFVTFFDSEGGHDLATCEIDFHRAVDGEINYAGWVADILNARDEIAAKAE